MKITIILLIIFTFFVSVHSEKDYSFDVLFIKSAIENPVLPFKHQAWNRLAYLTDTFGPRLWGSQNLELAIKHMAQQATIQRFDNIRLEPVSNFTKWVRGKQSLQLLDPRPVATPLKLIGLGRTVSGDVKAEVIVVKNWDELELNKDKINGKIVLYNNPWINYYQTVQYRVDGASRAAKYGAKAVLVRSVTPKSIESVHTGYMQYDPQQPKIPAAAISIQDADMFQRMQDRGQTIVCHLILQNEFVDGANSSNLIFEIKGTTYPDQIILAGGHIDSWDTGSQTGANDDGGGFTTVFQALRVLKGLGLIPKRTIRFIAWSGEQSGSPRDGAAQYVQRHLDELDKHVLAFQSDLGSTKLLGFGHTGSGTNIVQNILDQYLSLLDAGQYSNDGFSVDVQPLYDHGIPVIKNLIADTPDHEYYFTYHHSAGDSMSIMDPDDMDSNVAGIAAILYIIADLDTSIRSQHHIRSE